jgi:hypothetical protein
MLNLDWVCLARIDLFGPDENDAAHPPVKKPRRPDDGKPVNTGKNNAKRSNQPLSSYPAIQDEWRETIARSTETALPAVYERPPTREECVKKYGKAKTKELYADPALRFRMNTGIELVYKESSRNEQLRIWNNWNLMTNGQKIISDKKSRELFKTDNKTRHETFMKAWDAPEIAESKDFSTGAYFNKSNEAMGDIVNEEPPSGDADPDDTGLGGDGEGDGGGDSFDGGDSNVSIADDAPGKRPFAGMNGRTLLQEKIQELESGINEALEAASRVPAIDSGVVNDLMELKDEVSSLHDILFMVSFEDILVRYKICVRSYDLQVQHLKTVIDGLVMVGS